MNSVMEDKAVFQTKLKCIECGAEYSMDEVIYRCSKCDGLLEVRHDAERLGSVGADYWKQLFTERFRSPEHPYSSGVWGKKEWVLPEIALEHVVSLGEGATPMAPLPGLSRALGVADVRVKQCGVSHTGSFKDLGMTVLVSHVVNLISKGVDIRAVACASTGDTSAALAAYAAAAGIPTVVFLPAGKISTAQLVQPLANGAHVLSLDTDFDGCMQVVREVTKDKSIYLANSMNPLRIEGQKTISVEIVQQLGWEVPDWVIIPGGNLGNVSALGAGFKLLKDTGIIDRMPRICLAQAARANPLYRSFKKNFEEFEAVRADKTLASAIQIGNPVSYPRAVRTLKEFEGVVEQADEQELADASAFADRHGLFNCPHTGVALAALNKLIASGDVGASDRVVVVSTAHGLKFSEFKTGYHEDSLNDVQAKYRNEFIALPADTDKIQDALAERLAR